MKEDQHA